MNIFSTHDKVLFIYAHMDDETILSYGTMKYLNEIGCSINVLCLCGNGRQTDKNQNERKNVFHTITKSLNVNVHRENIFDLTLKQDIVEKIIKDELNRIKPNIVITHWNHDMHYEHRMISDIVRVACRQIGNSSVDCLLETTSQTSMQIFNTDSFSPSFFIDISKYSEDKEKNIKKYFMEIPKDITDLRSADSIMTWNSLYGKTINSKYSEPYNVVFWRCNRANTST